MFFNTTNLCFPIISNDTKGGIYEFNRMLLTATENVYLRVLDRDLSAAPLSPSEGDAYFVKAVAPVDDPWFGHDNEVAYYFNGWRFILPRIGMIMWVEDTDTRWILTENGWQGESKISNIGGGASEADTKAKIDVLILELELLGLIRP